MENITDAVRDEVVALYKQGVTTAEITERTGVKRPSIYYILRSRGLRPTRTARHNPETVTVGELLAQLAALERKVGRLQAACRAAAISEKEHGLLDGDLGE